MDPSSYRHPEVTATPLLRPPAASSPRAITPQKAERAQKTRAVTAAKHANQTPALAQGHSAPAPAPPDFRDWSSEEALAPTMQCAVSLRETTRPTKPCVTSNLLQGRVTRCFLEPSGPRFFEFSVSLAQYVIAVREKLHCNPL